MVSNSIPKGWNPKTVADICELKRGASPRPISDPKYFGNGAGWVRISDVTKSSRFLRETEQYLSELGESKSVRVYPNEAIMSICATIGKPVIVQMDACIHDGFVVFKNLSSDVDETFYLYWLQSKEPYFESLGQHGTQKNINTGLVKATEIALPPLTEQRKIAAILTSVDDAIAATQRIIDQTEVVKRGLMQQLLTKGIGHTTFKQTEIGEIPAQWEVVLFGDVVRIQAGYAFKSAEFTDNGDRLLRGSNVGVQEINWSDTKYFPTERRTEFAEYVLQSGDVVIAMDRPFVGNGFKVARITNSDMPALLLQRVSRIIESDKVLQEFTYLVLRSELYQSQLRNRQVGMDLPHISTKDIGSPLIPLPPVEEQKDIAATISSLDDKLRVESSHKQQLELLNRSLMQVLLTGKVRVNVDEPSEVSI